GSTERMYCLRLRRYIGQRGWFRPFCSTSRRTRTASEACGGTAPAEGAAAEGAAADGSDGVALAGAGDSVSFSSTRRLRSTCLRFTYPALAIFWMNSRKLLAP